MKNYRLLIYIHLLILFVHSNNVNGQSVSESGIVITGTVLSKDKKVALSGASVKIIGTNVGTQTDADGKFSIKLNNKSQSLQVTYIGFEPSVIDLKNADHDGNITVWLHSFERTLEAVTVSTGYQNLPKERVSGSFENVNNKTINQRVTSTVKSRLEGLTTIAFDKGNARPQMVIRGISSINGSNAPLIILNGFPFEGDFDRINPDDIQDITILKDAAASSIWGTRAGNGVIVVTTKKASFNQPLNVSLNSNVTFIQKPDLFYLDQMTPSEYIDVEKFLFSKGYYNSQENNKYARPFLTPVVELLIKQRDGLINNADELIDSYRNQSARKSYQDLIYKTGFIQQHTVNLKGGDTKGNYFLSAGYIRMDDEFGAINNRITINSDANYRFNTKFKMNSGISYIQRNLRSGAPTFQSKNSIYPYFRLNNSDGRDAGIPLYRKPYLDTAGAGKLLDWNYYPNSDYRHSVTKQNGQNLIARIGLQYDLFKGFSIQGNYQYERQDDQISVLNDIYSITTRNLINKFTIVDAQSGNVKYNLPFGAIGDESNGSMQTHNARIQLNYNLNAKDFVVNAIGGFEVRSILSKNNSFRNYGYDPDVLTISKVDYVNPYPTFVNGTNEYIPFLSSLGETSNRYVSTYLNAGVTYLEKYILTASGRRDASNLFGVNTNDKWQPLWSVGGAWIVTNENFFSWSALLSLKLRATYGYSGNVDLSRSAVTAIQYLPLPSSYTGYLMAYVSQFANPDLRWEKNRIINFGIDFNLKNNIATGSIEAYFKKGSDLYGATPIDQTAGVGETIVKNVANMKGHGVELNITSNIINRAVKWSNTVIFSYNKSKVTNYYLSADIGSSYINSGTSIKPLVGYPVYSIFTYKYAGLDDIGNPQGYIEDKTSTNYTSILGTGTKVKDLEYGGSAVPQYFGSFINTVRWRGWTISANIGYKFGYSFIKPSINYSSLFAGIIQSSDYANRWQQPGDEKHTDIPAMIYPAVSARETFYNSSASLVRKGDHIRLSYVNLSYDFNQTFLKSLGINQFRIYTSVSNLGILWRKNKDGIDPDFIAGQIPPGKAFSVGIQTNF